MNAYNGLTHANVAEAVLTLPHGHALALPSSYQFWDRSETYKTGGVDVPLNTPQRFNKFGPEANHIVPFEVLVEGRKFYEVY